MRKENIAQIKRPVKYDQSVAPLSEVLKRIEGGGTASAQEVSAYNLETSSDLQVSDGKSHYKDIGFEWVGDHIQSTGRKAKKGEGDKYKSRAGDL